MIGLSLSSRDYLNPDYYDQVQKDAKQRWINNFLEMPIEKIKKIANEGFSLCHREAAKEVLSYGVKGELAKVLEEGLNNELSILFCTAHRTKEQDKRFHELWDAI